MLRRETIDKARKGIQKLTESMLTCRKARKNTMAALVVHMEKLNTPDFPYAWFKERCVEKNNISYFYYGLVFMYSLL